MSEDWEEFKKTVEPVKRKKLQQKKLKQNQVLKDKKNEIRS